MIKLKYILFFYFAIFFILSGISFAKAQDSKAETAAEDGAALEIPVSFTYSSLYWWRGFVCMEGAGVLWPGVGAVLGDSGIELNLTTGISDFWLTRDDSAVKDSAKSYTEIDYSISYSKEIDIVSISLGLLYYQYPYYDEVTADSADPSFAEGSVSVGIKTILSPTIEFYYDYYIEARKDAAGEDLPTAEDYYAKFSVSHNIISTDDGFSLSAGASIGYYNNAYYEASGLSDAIINLGFAKDYDNLSVKATMYYGRSIGKDFQDANESVGAARKNHFWCDFGLTYTL